MGCRTLNPLPPFGVYFPVFLTDHSVANPPAKHSTRNRDPCECPPKPRSRVGMSLLGGLLPPELGQIPQVMIAPLVPHAQAVLCVRVLLDVGLPEEALGIGIV